ncbi:hypothetical protein [Actinacidiphila yanglinensis]|uniref:hypothetical protein n=1 Tax=Actinacidiphila yanglinensis TaxID=310779 RepID=UPI000CDE796A|nr:hypothetical protein [Actinacidiphila yanglinensis]
MYVVRYGWTRAGIIRCAGTALLIGLCFLPHVEPAGTDHIELVLSPLPLWITAVCSSRRKVLRLDKLGVTLYRLLPFRAPCFVPWAEVVAVDWSGRGRFWGRTGTLEVRRRTAHPVAALPAADGAGLEGLDDYLATQVDPDFAATFRSTTVIGRDTTLSRLDPLRLATELAVLAPHVRHFGDLGDFGGPGVLGGPGAPGGGALDGPGGVRSLGA